MKTKTISQTQEHPHRGQYQLQDQQCTQCGERLCRTGGVNKGFEPCQQKGVIRIEQTILVHSEHRGLVRNTIPQKFFYYRKPVYTNRGILNRVQLALEILLST